MPLLSEADLEVIKAYRAIMQRTEVQAIAKAVCMEERMNGGLAGISSGKGGRAWLDGEWQLEELDALCEYLRHSVIAEGCKPDDLVEVLLSHDRDEADEGPSETDPQIMRAATIAAQWWTDRVKVVHKPSFFIRLRDSIVEKLSALGEDDEIEILSDYEPDATLSAALVAARPPNTSNSTLNNNALPWKHSTFVSRRRVSPKAGYGNFLPDIPVVV